MSKKGSLLLSLAVMAAVAYFFNNKSHFTDITKFGYEQYQDIVINNKVVKKATGKHNCQVRYEVLKKLLDRYERPFTMLDIGASQGYYSFRTAYEYDSVCVMIEGNNSHYPMVGTQLLELCKANNQVDNIIFLNKSIIPEDLKMLSACEDFDVVLAMNVIHWFGDRWQEVADAILAMGDNIVIETPPEEKCVSAERNLLRKKIEDYLLSKNAVILGSAPRHTSDTLSNIYLIEGEKKTLRRKTWIYPKKKEDKFEIASNFKTKTITKRFPHANGEGAEFPWVPGINLLTFKMYNGAFPVKKTIKSAIEKIKDETHNDWMVNNMILQGSKLALIDKDDPVHGAKGLRYSKKRLKAIQKLVDIDDPAEVEKYFWNDVVQVR